MNSETREQLINIAKEKLSYEDVSHDFWHALRVLNIAEYLAKKEKADLDIVIPAALFHDLVNHPKHTPKAHLSSEESAEETKKILQNIESYPKEKIEKVFISIKSCSFSKGIIPDFLEGKIVQDSDMLESTGAISIMRTFASTGQMKRPFFNIEDPFCKKRTPDNKNYALDLFPSRLLLVQNRLHTKTAKRLGEKRHKFLLKFLKQVEYELDSVK